MPVATKSITEVIRERTILSMDEKINEVFSRNPNVNVRIETVPICCKCNKPTLPAAKHLVVRGEFRCLECFLKLVREHKEDFGLDEDDSFTEEELTTVAPECNHPYISNLFVSKKYPHFVGVSDSAPCS